MLQRIKPRWTDCVVAATGPSLTPEVAEACRGQNLIAVSDAYRLLPFAQVLYSCDAAWWEAHGGCPSFQGEKWSCHNSDPDNDNRPVAEKYGLRLVSGEPGDTFSLDPSLIRYGSNSGFQAINLALLFGCKRVVLVGFDMHANGGKLHFFGDHANGLRNCSDYARFIPDFETAARKLQADIQIINCTPGSALTCFRTAVLADALSCTP